MGLQPPERQMVWGQGVPRCHCWRVLALLSPLPRPVQVVDVYEPLEDGTRDKAFISKARERAGHAGGRGAEGAGAAGARRAPGPALAPSALPARPPPPA